MQKAMSLKCKHMLFLDNFMEVVMLSFLLRFLKLHFLHPCFLLAVFHLPFAGTLVQFISWHFTTTCGNLDMLIKTLLHSITSGEKLSRSPLMWIHNISFSLLPFQCIFYHSLSTYRFSPYYYQGLLPPEKPP